MRESLKKIAGRLLRSRLAMTGAGLCLLILPFLLLFSLFDLAGMVANPYFGFINYLVLGPLFCLGLLLLIIGLFKGGGEEDIGLFAYEYLKEQLTMPGRLRRVRRLLFFGAGLIFTVMMVVAVVTYSGVHYTDSVAFCGQFCHTVMEPQYTAYQHSPHSRVSCVRCHLGSAGQWTVQAKLSGIRQIFATALDTYPRPIPSPIVSLRPTRATCEECHRPEMFHGDRLVIREEFLADEENTAVRTVLLLKVGTGGYHGREAHGIHWHVSPFDTVRYRAADPQREKITEVRLQRADGSEKVFTLAGKAGETPGGEMRTMDCIDCHNRPSHIFLSPDEALDRKLLSGAIPTSLPYAKKVGLAAITGDYPSKATARSGITEQVRAWYQQEGAGLSGVREADLRLAIDGFFQAWQENVFPAMGVTWDTYRDFIGHRDDSGCFRCHNNRLRTSNGESIDNKCDTCHVILAETEPAPDVLKILRGDGRAQSSTKPEGATQP